MGVPTENRSLLPHEHGAYGQIAMPLVCALSLGRPGAAAWLLAAGAFAGFLSYEAVLVAVGRRGRRAQQEHGGRARRLAAGILGLAVLLAGAGFALAPPDARWASAVPPLLAAGVALLVRSGVERTVAGEVAVAVALSSAGLPVAMATGARPGTAAAAWLAWCLGLAAATLAVETVLARARGQARDPGPRAAGAVAGIQAVAVALALAHLVPAAVPAAVAPMALTSLAVIGLRMPARRLKQVGWLAVAGSAATLGLLVLLLR
jgi:hypothetical protein